MRAILELPAFRFVGLFVFKSPLHLTTSPLQLQSIEFFPFNNLTALTKRLILRLSSSNPSEFFTLRSFFPFLPLMERGERNVIRGFFLFCLFGRLKVECEKKSDFEPALLYVQIVPRLLFLPTCCLWTVRFAYALCGKGKELANFFSGRQEWKGGSPAEENIICLVGFGPILEAELYFLLLPEKFMRTDEVASVCVCVCGFIDTEGDIVIRGGGMGWSVHIIYEAGYSQELFHWNRKNIKNEFKTKISKFFFFWNEKDRRKAVKNSHTLEVFPHLVVHQEV